MPVAALSIVQKYHPNVRRVVDAKRSIEVTVTAEDCRSAKKGEPSQCAMARAFSREFDGAVISKAVSYLVKGKTAYRYITPQSVVREIVSFDRHQDFAPGDYGLRSPSESNSLAGQKKAREAKPVPGRAHLLKAPTQLLGKRHGVDSPGGHRIAAGLRKYHHKTTGIRSL